ncbi:MAG: hypothetical protein GY856_45040, partial [bacterium]|nr:hypothetical protein [bacterium]
MGPALYAVGTQLGKVVLVVLSINMDDRKKDDRRPWLSWMLPVLGWTVVVAVPLTLAVVQNRRITQEVARAQAEAVFDKDWALRLWAAS